MPCASVLFGWASTRGGSAYHGGLEDGEHHGGSVPMMPPELAHDELSLNQGVPRPALSLFLDVRDGGKPPPPASRQRRARTARAPRPGM